MLRRKGLILGTPLASDWRAAEGGLIKAVQDKFEAATPVRNLLNEKLSADG